MEGVAEADRAGLLRVAVVSEGVLGHGPTLQRVVDGLGAQVGIAAAGRSIPPPRRVGARLIASVPALGSLDAEVLRWRLRYSLRGRRALRAAGRDGADTAIVNTQSAALLSAGPMARTPTALSLDATGRQYDRMEMWRARGRGDAVVERVLELLERRALGAAALLVAWTGWTAASLRDEYGVDERRILVCHPGIDIDRWAVRSATRPPGEPARLLFVGNSAERKGLFELLDALETLTTPVALDVVSGDPALDPADPRFRLHRDLPADGPELRRLFADADAFVLPSRADMVPWVVLEALASGLPVVGSDVGAIPELVGDAGTIVPRRDPRALGRALEALLGDPARREAAGVAARRRAQAYERTDRARELAGALRAMRERADRTG